MEIVSTAINKFNGNRNEIIIRMSRVIGSVLVYAFRKRTIRIVFVNRPNVFKYAKRDRYKNKKRM